MTTPDPNVVSRRFPTEEEARNFAVEESNKRPDTIIEVVESPSPGIAHGHRFFVGTDSGGFLRNWERMVDLYKNGKVFHP